MLAHAVDAHENLAALADERRPAHGGYDPAVAHEVALAHGEVELARGGVDAAAAHLRGVQAVAHGADHLVVVVLAGGDEGVAHAAGRGEGVALAAAAAGGRHAHLQAVEPVDHVVLEDAVLDERQARGGRALVVDILAAPLAGHRAVVDGGDAGRGDGLPQLAGEFAHARLHAGGLQRVPAGLVEDHAAESPGDDHGHLARLAVRRVEHRHGSPRRAAPHGLGIHALAEQLKAHQRTGVVRAGLVLLAGAGHGRAGQPGVGARVAGVQPLAVGDEHMLLAGEQPGLHLRDARGDIARRPVRRAQDVRARLRRHGKGRGLHGVDVGMAALVQHHVAPGAARIGDGGAGALRRAQQPGKRHVAGVDIDGAQAVIDADARAARARGDGVFDPAGAQEHAEAAGILTEDLRKGAPARQCAGEHLLANG